MVVEGMCQRGAERDAMGMLHYPCHERPDFVFMYGVEGSDLYCLPHLMEVLRDRTPGLYVVRKF